MPCVILTLISRLVCVLWGGISWHLARAVTLLAAAGGGLIAAQSADKIDPSGKIDPAEDEPRNFCQGRGRDSALVRAPSSK